MWSRAIDFTRELESPGHVDHRNYRLFPRGLERNRKITGYNENIQKGAVMSLGSDNRRRNLIGEDAF